jgi:CTP:molybdopterin cytidylyltransferase MocA
MKHESFAAIVLSAGFSSRMGAFKPLLRLGEETALEKVVNLFRRAEVEHLQVIVGHQAELLKPLVERLGVSCTVNPSYRDGMFSSVQSAMRKLPEGTDGFFLLPVDTPLVRSQTVKTLQQAWRTTCKGIIHPVFLGERGHPPVISTRYRQMILESSGEGGLKALLSPFTEDILEIEVPDEHCVLDMDTPRDYAYLRQRWENYAYPSYQECEHLLTHHFAVSPEVAEHCRQVARVAVTLVVNLNRAGLDLNRERIKAAAMLHDGCRAQPDHAAAGAKALYDLGFKNVADLVATHMDITVSEGDDPLPQEVLYLADKMVAGSRLVPLEERFAGKLKRFSDQSDILEAVQRRLAAATRIRQKCEAIIKKPLSDLICSNALASLKG